MSAERIALKTDQLVGAVIRCLRADKPAWLWSFPGAGKTEIVFQLIGPALDLPVYDFRANSKEPIDLRGLPAISEDRSFTTWVPPEDLPTGPALLFVDEINTCPQSLVAPLYSIVHEKRLGNWRGHKNLRIIAAGNRSEDRAVAHKMSTALLTRFGHFDMEVDYDQWCRWGAQTGRISPTMIAFVRFREGTVLSAFNPDARTSPTPRTVEAADRVYRQNPPESTFLAEIGAHVGLGFAHEFMAFVQLWHKLPNIDDVLKDPQHYPMPQGRDSMSIRFALAAALSARLSNKNLEPALIFLDRLGEEFSVFALKDAIARDPLVTKDPKNPERASMVFTKWGASHADLLG